MRCPNCKADVPEDIFCNACGARLPQVSAPAPPGRVINTIDRSGQTVIRKDNHWHNSTAALLGLAVVAVIVLALGGFWLLTWQAQQERIAAARATATAEAQGEATAAAVAAANRASVEATELAVAAAAATAQAIEALYARGAAAMQLGDWPTAYDALRAVFDVDAGYRDVPALLAVVIPALTPTVTPTPTATDMPTATATPTDVPTATATSTATAEPTQTATATFTPAPTVTPLPTATPVPTAAATSTATLTAAPTATATSTATAKPTPPATATAAPVSAASAGIRVRVEGFGLAPPAETNPSLRSRLALLAAETDARRNLALWLDGAEVDTVRIFSETEVISDTIRIEVKAHLPAARIVAQRYDAATGEARVTLEAVIEE